MVLYGLIFKLLVLCCLSYTFLIAGNCGKVYSFFRMNLVLKILKRSNYETINDIRNNFGLFCCLQ